MDLAQTELILVLCVALQLQHKTTKQSSTDPWQKQFPPAPSSRTSTELGAPGCAWSQWDQSKGPQLWHMEVVRLRWGRCGDSTPGTAGVRAGVALVVLGTGQDSNTPIQGWVWLLWGTIKGDTGWYWVSYTPAQPSTGTSPFPRHHQCLSSQDPTAQIPPPSPGFHIPHPPCASSGSCEEQEAMD